MTDPISATGGTSSSTLFSWLGLIGGFAGLATLLWRVLDYRRAFLTIGLIIDTTDAGGVKLRTEIKNANINSRILYGVFIVVSPREESPMRTSIKLMASKGEETEYANYNQMVRSISKRIQRTPEKITDDEGRLLIPLPYYFRENIGIGDETLSFEVIIPKSKLPPGVYSARLYVDALKRYHRVVQAAFDIAPPSEITPLTT